MKCTIINKKFKKYAIAFSIILTPTVLGITFTDSHDVNLPQLQPKKSKNIKLKKNKKGQYQITWAIFNDYDSKERSPGNHLKKIVGQKILLKGFMIPLDYSAKNIKNFLLVPYIPTCIHIPPPPENMIINVLLNQKKGIKPSYYPIEINGKLKFTKGKKSSDPYLPNGVFTINAASIREVKN